ncbi:MAG: DMT family transporter [Homoserinimonas sp.]
MKDNLALLRRSTTLLQFLGMGLIWGSSFLFMKVALTGVAFTQIAWSRVILGAMVLAVFMLIGRHKVPREPIIWVHFTVIAIFNCIIPHLLFAWAEQHVSSSLAAIYNSITPIATAVMVALVFRVEKLTRNQLVGIVIGITGVLLVIGPWQTGTLTGDLYGQLACIVAGSSYGVAIGYLRKFVSQRPIPGTTVAFMNIGMAAVIMILLTPVMAIAPVQLDFWVVSSLLLLGGLGSGLAYIWNIAVLRAWGPTSSSTVTYMLPVVGIVLGVVVLHETFTWNQPLGALLVMLGIVYTQGRLKLPTRWRIRPRAVVDPDEVVGPST